MHHKSEQSQHSQPDFGNLQQSKATCKSGKFECVADHDGWCTEKQKKCDELTAKMPDGVTFETKWKKRNTSGEASCRDGHFECSGDTDWCAEQEKESEFCGPRSKLFLSQRMHKGGRVQH